MADKIEGVPTEVWEARAILQKRLVGDYLYNKVQETIKKYPEYFAEYLSEPPQKIEHGFEYRFNILLKNGVR